MDHFSMMIVLAGAFTGFVAGTLGTEVYWKKLYKIYTERIVKQYTWILNDFGIYKTVYGTWEMKYRDKVWVKKDEPTGE